MATQNTTPTSTPVPSTKPQDATFNMESLDIFVNDAADTFNDRFGVERLTIAGIAALAGGDGGLALAELERQAVVESVFKRSLLSCAFDANTFREYESPYGLELKQLTDVVTTARSTTGTRINPLGTVETIGANIARIEYDPATGAPLGLLCEAQATNLLLESALGRIAVAAPWAVFGGTATTTIAQQSLNGSTALLFNDTDASNVSVLRQLIPITSSANSYVCSAHFKAGTSGKVYLRFALTGGSAVLSTNVFVFASETFENGSGSFQKYTDGSYRISVVITDNASGNNSLDFRLGATGVSGSETGSVLMYDAQVTQGSTLLNYTPTTTSQVTRDADGNVLTPLHNENEFTVYAHVKSAALTSNLNRMLGIGTSASNRIELASTALVTTINGDVSRNINYTVPASEFKIAYTFKAGVVKLYANGSVIGSTDVAATLTFASTGLRIGSNTAGALPAIRAVIPRVEYFPRALSDSELIALTAV